jgi:uncharacterized RDD family membrane protein YckC
VNELRRFGGVEDEQAPVTYELATWGVRAWAYLIDLLIFFGLGLLIAAGALIAEGDTDDARNLAETLTLAIGIPLGLAYAPLLMMRRGERNGQSLGKQAMRIRVVRESGDPVTLGNGLLREVIGRQLLVAFTYGLYAVVDYLWPLWDRPRQCLHDKVAQTRVVRVQPLADDGATFTTGVDAHAPPPDATSSPDAGQPTSGRSTVPPPPPPGATPVRDGWLPPTAGR